MGKTKNTILETQEGFVSVQELRDAHNLETQNLKLYAEVSRKLQLYSASIKAAVSSLLNHDFFWDSANQHEFLESINTSVSQVSDLTVLLTLAFRAEAGTLELDRELHELQEILSVSLANARLRFPELQVKVHYPLIGYPVLVDYEYLTKAFLLLMEVLNAENQREQVNIVACEEGQYWLVEISNLSVDHVTILQRHTRTEHLSSELGSLSVENILRLKIVSEIIRLQDIDMEVHRNAKGFYALKLKIKKIETPSLPEGI